MDKKWSGVFPGENICLVFLDTGTNFFALNNLVNVFVHVAYFSAYGRQCRPCRVVLPSLEKHITVDMSFWASFLHHLHDSKLLQMVKHKERASECLYTLDYITQLINQALMTVSHKNYLSPMEKEETCLICMFFQLFRTSTDPFTNFCLLL